MIRRLRRRLILASMLSLAVVLLAIVGGMNLLHYRTLVKNADGMLALLQENGGSFPRMRNPHLTPKLDPSFDSPELPHITRYFSALVSNGVAVDTDTSRIAAVDAASAGDYALQAMAKDVPCGFVDGYRFLRYEDAGGMRVLFLDCQRSLSDARSVLLLSAELSLLGCATVLLLLLLLSGRLVRPLSESYEKQRRFITDAGHEIKTPLTIIEADAEVLEMEQGKSEWLSDIRSQTTRLSALTNDLIALSRMEEQQRAEHVTFPLSDVAEEIAASFLAPARAQGKALHISIQPMLSCCGSQRDIAQLLSILLDNAIKYSVPDSAIGFTLERRGKSARICVENQTSGISSDTLKSMFDRFYRGDPARSSAVKGYGVGLSIAKAVVENHRGRISAASTDGRLLRISVNLPL